jgi:hypothetical protein
MSTGVVSVPLWIPQLAMVIGLGILLIALLDELVIVAARRPADLSARAAEERRGTGRARRAGRRRLTMSLPELSLVLLGLPRRHPRRAASGSQSASASSACWR